MTTEDIKRIVDDERAEQLTVLLCRHWEVASARLEALVEDIESDMEICVEAEIYAAIMRMQSAVMALMELNKIPTAYLFSEYIDRIAKSVSDTSIRCEVDLVEEGTLRPWAIESVNKDRRLIYERA